MVEEKTEKSKNQDIIIPPSPPPVMINQPIEIRNEKEAAEGGFTKIDESLDRIIYSLFNTSIEILTQGPQNFVFNNDFSFDF
jgi:hypothetical protein